MIHLLILPLLLLPLAATAQETPPEDRPEPFACFAPVDPVVTLGHPSRYEAGSKSRSDFDEEAEAEVERALKPIDDFITDLATTSDLALSGAEDAEAATDCVLDRLSDWAKADALSDLTTESARLSTPSRLAGLAFAHAKVASLAPDDPRNADITDWLKSRMTASMAFFDDEAPPRASKNNLRAWAALAAARIGLSAQDDAMTQWAADSTRLVACQAEPSGALPLEMWRGRLALHYQIHAVGPLAVTAALLPDENLFDECDRAIPRIAGFIARAIDDPSIVQDITGKKQKYGPPEPHEFAWTAAYLSQLDDPEIEALAKRFDRQGNSKLGGDQSLLW